MKKTANKKTGFGFTLAELIVVITVLAILATVGFLALSGYAQDARASRNAANLRSVQSAIVAEAAITNNSPRYYVSHDADYALSGAVSYVDGAPVSLTGGNVGEAPSDSNYTAGKPRWDRLKLNPDKFRLSFLERTARANAAFETSSVSVWAVDLSSKSNGRVRAVSYLQTVAIQPDTGKVLTSGNFPAPTAGEMASGATLGLVRNPVATWADAAKTALVGETVANVPPSEAPTVPETPAPTSDPNASQVALLLHGEGANGAHNKSFVDASGNSYTFTPAGNVHLGSKSPYSNAGGSAYFDGAGDYVDTSASTNFKLDGDFTIDGWFNLTATTRPSLPTVFTLGDYSNGILFRPGNHDDLYVNNAAVSSKIGANFPLNQWNHFAFVRTGTTLKVYANGTEVYSGTVSWVLNTWGSRVRVGTSGHSTSENFPGFISDFRIVKGSALYSWNFSVPTSPSASVAGTVLLMPFSNGGIVDAKRKANFENIDTAAITTAQKKFGNSSIAFDGTSDGLRTRGDALVFWSNDFAVEFWYYPTATNRISTFLRWDNNAVGWVGLDLNHNATSLKLSLDGGVTNIATAPVSSLTANAWNHLAFVRSGSTWSIYVNGVSKGSGTSSASVSTPTNFYRIWENSAATSYSAQGYLDEFRVTIGSPRYTADFAVPTAEFADN